ncbi:hypothetical protein J6590_003576 [Homalodisca vitripennis]|nr:hypothetical protein J6590_003576 [Homalodisca vitripennis]
MVQTLVAITSAKASTFFTATSPRQPCIHVPGHCAVITAVDDVTKAGVTRSEESATPGRAAPHRPGTF